MASEAAFNYRYFADWAARVGGPSLDYGCGRGKIIELGLARGLDVWGADTFEGGYATWRSDLSKEVAGRIRSITAARSDYPDCHFDLVICNQVIEHVRSPEQTFADIFRVLKPGGLFLAAFPVAETWFEGHVGLYFAHWLPPQTAVRRFYLELSHRLGLGLQREGSADRSEWVRHFERFLDDDCFYHPRKQIVRTLRATFGAEPLDLSVDYMRARLGKRVALFPDAPLRFIYHKRAGEIFKISKSGK
jgi:SAM-dependent methyltransferase